MVRLSLVVCLCVLFLVTAHPNAAAAPRPQTSTPTTDEAFEQAILDRLARINPEAVPVFREATLAYNQEDAQAAKQGFEQVLRLAPDFPDALRRLANVELLLGDAQSALAHARRAYALDATPYNASVVASALLATEDQANAAEALDMAEEAVKGLPDDPYANVALLLAGMANESIDAVRRADTTLLRSVPDYAPGHLVAGLLAAEGGQWEKAERELLLARDLGYPVEEITRILEESNIAGQARTARLRRQGLIVLSFVLAAWLGGMVLLFLLGLVLSKLTIAAVRRPPRGEAFTLGTGERIVRGLYAVVIALTSAYFYLSLPVLAAIIVIGVGGLIYFMPLGLMIMVGVMGFYTVAAIVWSVFTRVRETEPGRPLPRAEAPALWALTKEVAARVGTRPTDAIYMTPGVEVGVAERGGLLRKLRGEGFRHLIVGLGALPGMTQAEFCAILAHEYGHFSNRDTAGGNLAHQVRVSMYNMAYRLASRGLARWYNPAWLFINGFNRVFLRVTLGASRLQEILADRQAAITYGVRNFVDALTRIVRLDLAFDIQMDREIALAYAEGRALHNIYALPPVETPEERETFDKRLSEVMSRPTSPYDSHPAVSERIRLLQPLADRYDASGNQAPVWDLFENLDSIQSDMTALVEKNVARHQAAQRAGRAAFHRELALQSVPEVRPYQEALAKAIESGDLVAEAEALQDLGGIYEERGVYTEALLYYTLAVASCVERKDQEGERVARFNLAEVHKAMKEYAEAEKQLVQVVALDEATDCPDLQADRQELDQVQGLRAAPDAP